jgi:alpha/beta superfamily hydrolase
MGEFHVKIPVSHGHLEAALRDPRGTLRGGAVFCHPHPIHGGTMHTKAVYRAGQAFLELGLRSLRFNFRGVGCSTGTFDDGIGEEEDVMAALDWLELGGIREMPMVVGGVSFGSMVGLTVGAEDPRVTALVGMGTPIHLYDYSYLADVQKPVLIIQGEEDEFGSAVEVREVLGALGSHVTVEGIPASGHLFEGHFEQVQELIREFFSRGPGARVLAGYGRYLQGVER